MSPIELSWTAKKELCLERKYSCRQHMASPPWFGESLPSDLYSQKAKTLPWFQHGNMLRVFSHVKPRSELLVKSEGHRGQVADVAR